MGLPDGTYKFTETKAPDGYSINSNIDEVTLNEESKLGTNGDYSASIVVPDTKLAALPGAGGIGTTIFTIAGILLMVAAAAMYFARRRRA
jgi:LPXTG-motif cell wall-anchored protein